MKLVKVTAIVDRIINFFSVLVVVLLTFMMLSVSFGVVMRYFLKRSPIWVIEVTEYSLLYITFLGAAWLLKKEGHVKMDLVLNMLKPGTQALMNTITSVLCAIVTLIVAWYGAKVSWDHYDTGYRLSSILRPPSALIVAIIPVGSFMLFLQFLRRTCRHMREFREYKRRA